MVEDRVECLWAVKLAPGERVAYRPLQAVVEVEQAEDDLSPLLAGNGVGDAEPASVPLDAR